MLIPGGGERKTLRVLARSGDLWHVRGTTETLLHKLELLRGYCDELGRSVDEIELVTGNPVIIRDDAAAAEAVYDDVVRSQRPDAHRRRHDRAPPGELLGGPPAAIAAAWRPYVELGFRHIVVDFASPYDRETLERLPEVRALLD